MSNAERQAAWRARRGQRLKELEARVRELEAALRNKPEAARAATAEFEFRVGNEVARRLREALPDYERAYEVAKMITASHDGVMSRREYRQILARLSPDAHPGSDPIDQGLDEDAFKVFSRYEKVLCKPEAKPLPSGTPTTEVDWAAARRAVRAKRSAAAKRGVETRRARSGKAPRLEPPVT